MVVNGNGQHLLGRLLANDVFVKVGSDFSRLRKFVESQDGAFAKFFEKDVVTEVDALITDIDARARDQLLNLTLTLRAKIALDGVDCFTYFCHD